LSWCKGPRHGGKRGRRQKAAVEWQGEIGKMKCSGDARSITPAMATQQLLIEMGKRRWRRLKAELGFGFEFGLA